MHDGNVITSRKRIFPFGGFQFPSPLLGMGNQLTSMYTWFSCVFITFCADQLLPLLSWGRDEAERRVEDGERKKHTWCIYDDDDEKRSTKRSQSAMDAIESYAKGAPSCIANPNNNNN